MANDTKYITLENLTRLANKIKADIQLKQDQLQFAELPDPATYSGKVVQYVGNDTAELKAGAFYKSDGVTWAQVNVTETSQAKNVEVVNGVYAEFPSWEGAREDTLYFDVNTSKLWLKDANNEGRFILISEPAAAQKSQGMIVVDALPEWEDAREDTLYFVKPEGKTYIKEPTEENRFSIVSEPALALVNSLPAWADADASKVYAVKQVGEAYTNAYMPDDQSGFILVGSNDPSKTPDPTHMIVFNSSVTEDDLATINATQANVSHYMPSTGKLYMQLPEGTDADEAIAGMNGAGTAKANRWVEVDASAINFVIHTYDTLPSYADALAQYHADIDNGANVSCFIVTGPAESSLGFYAKKADETGAWYTVQTSGAAQPVDLPTFTAISDADIEAAFED